jgi:putative Mg2+ transporter-C (MgtC) family protein
MLEFLDFLRTGEIGWLTVTVRLVLAVFCGGFIGLERERKRRPAGFRTHILICLGAAMTTLTSQFLVLNLGANTDMARLGAQVIAGVGFIGAGTIIVTKRRQVKGLTTAAGLWASACMGLAIGAGFYFGAIVGCLLIILTVSVLSILEVRIMSTARNMNIYIEYTDTNDIGAVIDAIKSMNVKIFDVEITRIRSADGLPPCAIYSVRLPKKLRHADLMAVIATISGVQTVEEL